jgi:hypothetical protein
MIKLSGIIILVFLHQVCSAQNNYGFFAGAQRTTAHYSIADEKQETSEKYGAHAGFLIKIPFEKQFYFAPALYYTQKGFSVNLTKPSFPPGEDAISNDISVHSIEIAPLFQLDLSTNPSHFFIRLGPALDFIFSGREKIGLKNGTIEEQNMKFSFGDYGRITSSANIQLGYETQNGFQFWGFYNYGLGSMNNADEGPKIRHRWLGLSIGKYFATSKN